MPAFLFLLLSLAHPASPLWTRGIFSHPPLDGQAAFCTEQVRQLVPTCLLLQLLSFLKAPSPSPSLSPQLPLLQGHRRGRPVTYRSVSALVKLMDKVRQVPCALNCVAFVPGRAPASCSVEGSSRQSQVLPPGSPHWCDGHTPLPWLSLTARSRLCETVFAFLGEQVQQTSLAHFEVVFLN